MTQQEFETRIGNAVCAEDFEKANRAYMAAGILNKDTFCKSWKNDPVNQSVIVDYLVDQVEKLSQSLSRYMAQVDDLARLAADKSYDHDDDELRRAAIEALGDREYIKHILSQGADLSSDDRDLVLELL